LLSRLKPTVGMIDIEQKTIQFTYQAARKILGHFKKYKAPKICVRAPWKFKIRMSDNFISNKFIR
jgi:hypothetical protein